MFKIVGRFLYLTYIFSGTNVVLEYSSEDNCKDMRESALIDRCIENGSALTAATAESTPRLNNFHNQLRDFLLQLEKVFIQNESFVENNFKQNGCCVENDSKRNGCRERNNSKQNESFFQDHFKLNDSFVEDHFKQNGDFELAYNFKELADSDEYEGDSCFGTLCNGFVLCFSFLCD